MCCFWNNYTYKIENNVTHVHVSNRQLIFYVSIIHITFFQWELSLSTFDFYVQLPPWLKEVILFGTISLSVCLFICLFVCGQHYSNSYDWIGMKFYGGVLGGTMKNITFWWWSRSSKMSKWTKYTIITVAWPDQGQVMVQNLWGYNLLPPRLNNFTVDNMGVMICLSQGGLSSPSVSRS